MKRRDFLRNIACSSVAFSTGGALFSQLGMIDAALAAASGCPAYPPVDDYKALVCVFLQGGNDSFNLLVPSDGARYATYAASRGAMAIAQNALVPIAALGTAGGETYGLHPSCPELASLFDAGHGAFVVNVGTVLQPTTKAQYLTPGYPLPPQLFSHADQQGQWQYGQPAANGSTGWGGLAADRLHVLNAGATIPMSISLAGQNRFQAGMSVQPYSISSAGPTALAGYTGANGATRLAALEALLAQSHPDPLTRTYAGKLSNAIDWYNAMESALAGAPPIATPFPADNPVADALKEIAKVISVRGGFRRSGRSSSSRTGASTRTTTSSTISRRCSRRSRRRSAHSMRRPRSSASRTRLRRSRCPSSRARSTPTATAPTTPGAASSSSWAARCSASGSTARRPRAAASSRTRRSTGRIASRADR